MSLEYLSLNEYLKGRFGCKVYKLALSTGFSCPNRDGKCGTEGCIFCSAGGSGDFASSALLPVSEQIAKARERIQSKLSTSADTCRYIAYFQSFTSTYGPVERMRELFYEAINAPDVVVLSIATRPDCLPEEVLELLSELNRIKPVWVELGLQTIHEKSAEFINRGYPLREYEEAVKNLKERDIEVITHLILGLPGETEEMMLQSVDYVAHMPVQGVKLQLLHILEGTRLGDMYREACKLQDENQCFEHSGHTQGSDEISGLERFWHTQGSGEISVSDCLQANLLALNTESSIKNEVSDLYITPSNLLQNLYISELNEYVSLVVKCLELLPETMVVHRVTGDAPRKDLLYPAWSSDKKRILNEIRRLTV